TVSKCSRTGFRRVSVSFRELHLGEVHGGGLLSIGSPPLGISAKPSITFKSVTDFSVESIIRFKSIRFFDWLESAGVANRISAPAIGTMSIVGRAGELRGDLETS